MGPYPANPEPKGGVATRKANFLEYLRVAKVFWIIRPSQYLGSSRPRGRHGQATCKMHINSALAGA